MNKSLKKKSFHSGDIKKCHSKPAPARALLNGEVEKAVNVKVVNWNESWKKYIYVK